MLKEITDLGWMAVLGGPAMLKWVPKQAVGRSVQLVVQHYLKAGTYLQEAMQDASRQAIQSLAFGLQPRWWKGLLQSRVGRQFVQNFQTHYLEPFLAGYPVPTRDGFCHQGSQACKHILQHLNSLIDHVTPTEEDVQRFWVEIAEDALHNQIHTAEEKLLQRIQSLDSIPPDFLALLRFRNLLFQAIQFFFRQCVAHRPDVAALQQELHALHLSRQQEQLQQDMRALRASILGPFAQHVGVLVQQLSLTLSQMQEEVGQVRSEIAQLQQDLDAHHNMTHVSLAQLAQGQSDITAALQEIQRWIAYDRSAHMEYSLQARLEPIQQLLIEVRQEPQPAFHKKTIPGDGACGVLGWIGPEGQQLRTIYIFLSPQIRVGRSSNSDLVLHWLPLPQPPDAHNPAWLNWQGQGRKHPCLSISSHHMNLLWQNDSLFCKDTSNRGTWCNQQRLPAQRLTALEDGSILTIADVLSLSYQKLVDEQGQPIGWRLQRIDNAPGIEEYIFLQDLASLWIGTLPQVHIYTQTSSQEPVLLELQHINETLLLHPHVLPASNDTPERTAASGVPQVQRVVLGEHRLWLIPPQGGDSGG